VPNPIKAGSIAFSKIETVSVDVAWGAATGNFEKYIVEYEKVGVAGSAKEERVANTILTISLKGLAIGTKYKVSVMTIVGTTRSKKETKEFNTSKSIQALNF
jgi:hypothetical protein